MTDILRIQGGTPLANLIFYTTGLFLIAATSFLYIDYLVVYVYTVANFLYRQLDYWLYI